MWVYRPVHNQWIHNKSMLIYSGFSLLEYVLISICFVWLCCDELWAIFIGNLFQHKILLESSNESQFVDIWQLCSNWRGGDWGNSFLTIMVNDKGWQWTLSNSFLDFHQGISHMVRDVTSVVDVVMMVNYCWTLRLRLTSSDRP